MQSVADRIAELRRTKKRSSQSIANWIARERRRGNHWLADSIAAQAGKASGDVLTPWHPPQAAAGVAFVGMSSPKQQCAENSAMVTRATAKAAPARPRYWWQDD